MASRVTSQSITYFMHNHFLFTFDLVLSEHLAVINISPVSISLSELNKISLNGSNARWCHLLKFTAKSCLHQTFMNLCLFLCGYSFDFSVLEILYN